MRLARYRLYGQTLINDENIAGDRAFNWEKQFPEIFKQGGFDIVIGNPPYVDVKNLPKNITQYLFSNYSTGENRINLYSIFIEKGISLIKNSGFLSFINPNSILVNSSYKKIRELLIDSIKQIIKLPDNVFPDAKVETMIFVYEKNSNCAEVDILSYSKDDVISEIDQGRLAPLKKESWYNSNSLSFNLYLSSSYGSIISKIETNSFPLVKYAEFSLGITPYDKYKGHSEEEISTRAFHSIEKIDDRYKKLIEGENITRYYTLPHINEYLKYGNWLGRPREERFFKDERIMARQIISGDPPRIYASYSDEHYYYTHHGFGIIPNKELSTKYLLAILNSKLINFYHTYKFLDIEKRLFQKFLIENCKQLPIRIISEQRQLPFVELSNIMLEKSKEFYNVRLHLITLLQGKYPHLKIRKKLNHWPSLTFEMFLKEFTKQNINITISEQAEWLIYFNEQKTNANMLQKEIGQTDQKIDKMVYSVYNLTDDDISIIENAM